jgi:hypothetical protein
MFGQAACGLLIRIHDVLQAGSRVPGMHSASPVNRVLRRLLARHRLVERTVVEGPMEGGSAG